MRIADATKIKKPKLHVDRSVGVDLRQLEEFLRSPRAPRAWPDRWQVKIDGERVEIESNDSWATKPAAFAAVHRWLTRSGRGFQKLRPGPDVRLQWIAKHVEVLELPALQEARRILEDHVQDLEDRNLRLAVRGAINAIGEVT